MNIRVLNNDLSQYGIVAGFESVEFIRAFNTKGRFKLAINANNATAKYVKIDKIVYIDADKVGYIDKVILDKKSNKTGEYIIAEGVEIKDELNRIIYPDSGLETDSYTGEYLETIIKSLLNKNAGSLASEARQIPYLTTAANQMRGIMMDYSARYKDVSTEIYSLLASQEMGLKAEIDFDNNDIVFDVVIGNDLKAQEGLAGGIVLSLETKTALEIVDTDDRLSYRNLSVTAGLGEGAERTIMEVGTSSVGYERREVFADARDIGSDDELATRGAQKLAEISKTRGISVKANNQGSYKIGVDYDLGDYVSVDTKGELCDAQIIKLKYNFQKESIPTVDVSLNFDVDDALLKDISAKHMNYDALLASSASKKTVADVILTESYASIEVTDLDIVADGVYDFVISGDAASGGGVYIFANTDTTPSNYASQSLRLNGTTSTVARYAAPVIIAGDTAQFTVHGIMQLNPKTKHFVVSSKGSEEVNTVEGRIYEVVSINTFDNIDKITFYNPAGNFIAGTRLTMTLRG